MDTKIKDKITKLLRLAQDKSSVHEAATAFAHAQRLAARAGLDLESIDVDADADWHAPEVQAVAHRIIVKARRLPYWKAALLAPIARGNGCDLFKKAGVGLVVYGQPRDLDTVEVFFHAAVSDIDRLASAQSGNGRSWLHSFRCGAAHEIGNAIQRAARTALDEPDEPEPEAQSETALMRRDALASYRRDADAALDRHRDGLRLGRSVGTTVNERAYAAGRAAGATVRVSGHKALAE